MALIESTAAITAQNTFSTFRKFKAGTFDLSIEGTFVGTVTLQKRDGSGGTIRDAIAFTGPVEQVVEVGSFETEWRIGIKTGDFTSGTANVGLRQ